MSSTSFNKFVMQYMDHNEYSNDEMSHRLGVSYGTFCWWLYMRGVPTAQRQEYIRQYFKDKLRNVVFDNKKFIRVAKITRPDGTTAIYDTDVEAREIEKIPYSAFQDFKNTQEPISFGKAKGYLVETEYKEVYWE